MIRKIFFALIIFLIIFSTLFSQMKAMFKISGEGVGYTLLNDILVTFEGFDLSNPEEGKKRVISTLNKCMSDAQKARDQGKIDPIFFKRYKRILFVLRLCMIPMLKEKSTEEIVIGYLIEQELKKFEIKNKLKAGDKDRGIPHLAGLVAEELLNLKNYLDNKKNTKEPLLLSESVKPRIIKKVKPLYPASAKKENIKGLVKMEVVIDKRGNVIKVKIIKGQKLFADSAIKAVKQFKYEPFVLNKKPRSVKFIEKIEFK